MNFGCWTLIGLSSYIELRVFSRRKLVSGCHIMVSGLLLLKGKNSESETNFTYFLQCDH